MKISKEASMECAAAVSDEDMALINGFSKKTLTADEVYVFDIKLCDNDVDRDFERFSTSALSELAELFVGKTGIFDHQWSAAGQKARIFKTEVITDPERSNCAGEDYAYLKASAYMLRKGNEDLIAEIDAGIKREVSVGCSMAESVCSICGENAGSSKCGHVPGREYGGRMCYNILSGASDAYEWSFVAVPAQKEAGVMKKFSGEGETLTLEKFLKEQENDAYAEEYGKLKELSKLGESYLAALREQVVRLGLLSDCGFDGDFLRRAAAKMGEEELLGFKKAFESKVDRLLPPDRQLENSQSLTAFSGEEFII